MRNGDRISGTVIELQEGTLKLQSPYAGELSIEWDSINGIRTERAVRVQLANGDRITAALNSSKTGVELTSQTLGTFEIPLAKIVQIAPTSQRLATDALQAAQKTIQSMSQELAQTQKSLADSKQKYKTINDIGKLWSGNISLQGSGQYGNEEELEAYISALAKRTTPHEVLTLRGEGGYGETEGEVDTQEARGQVNMRVFMDEKKYVFGDVLGEHDMFEEIEFRLDAAAGGGYRWWQTERSELLTDIGAGFSYEVDEFSNTNTEPTVRLGLEFTQSLFEASKFSQELTVYPELSNFGGLRLISRTNYNMPINDSLAWTISLINEYDSDPSQPGIEENDINIRTGLQYNF